MHRLSANLPGHRVKSMEYNVTSGLRLRIWTAMRPNLAMNFWRDSLSACRRLASAADVMGCDQLVTYCALKRLARVSKTHMDL